MAACLGGCGSDRADQILQSNKPSESAATVYARVADHVVTVRAYVVHTRLDFVGEDRGSAEIDADDVLVTSTRITPAASLGSGVILGPSEVVTNCHVIMAGHEATISVAKDDELQSSVAALDLERDLCLLEVDMPSVKPLKLRPFETLRVGERVYSLGSPAGLSQSLGEGIISALRSDDQRKLIQTTAPISPGSSGGGLFDSKGWLVGITTSKMQDSEQLNFAIPADWIADIRSRDVKRRNRIRVAEEQYSKVCMTASRVRAGMESCGPRGNDRQCMARVTEMLSDAVAGGTQWTLADPWAVSGWTCLATARIVQRRYDEAVTAIEKAVDIRPLPNVLVDAAQMYRMRAEARQAGLRSSDLAKALEYAMRAAQADPLDDSAWVEMAYTYIGLGNPAQAHRAAERAARLDSEHEALRSMLEQQILQTR